MYPFYANASPSARPSHHQLDFAGTAQYPRPSPNPPAIVHDRPPLSFYEMIKKEYTDRDSKLRDAISHTSFHPENKSQCLDFVQHLRIHKHLFMYTYVHLVVCCQSRDTRRLVDIAKHWKRWGSIEQLAKHSLIRDELLSFGAHSCSRHQFLRAQCFGEDESDLLCHLLYCGRKPELYDLCNKPGEFEQVVELLWQFLKKLQKADVARRLHAHIYRMARKSAYLPSDLQIGCPISNKRKLGGGANGTVVKARMNGLDVAIKEISCSDGAAQRKCLKMFAGEAILWGTLQHKNIVPFLGIVRSPLGIGLVSPFFKNGNIKDRMGKYNPNDWPALARGWARDLAKALEYIHCHEPPIVHGDLKGDNVLVNDEGHACLGDFGQSYASDSGRYLDSSRVGEANNPMYWMAPELLANDYAKASDKADIYSFGCVLYEMLTGRAPFQNYSEGQVLAWVQKGERPNCPESISSNDPLWQMVQLCWRSRPEDRPSAAYLVSLGYRSGQRQ